MPLLYIGHARGNTPMKEVEIATDYLTFFKSFKPQQVAAATHSMRKMLHGDAETDKDFKKHYVLNGAIGGLMVPNSRHSNEATRGRDILPLDFDHIENEQEFLDSLRTKLGAVNIGYVLYKTFSYRTDNVRYRLLIPLDRMITSPTEFRALMEAMAKVLGTELDEASTHWGQIFFLPVETENNSTNLIRVVDGNPWVISEELKGKIMSNVKDSAPLKKPVARYQTPKYKTRLGFALDHLADGTANKNTYKQLMRFFYNIGMSSNESLEWLDYFDTLQQTPPDRLKPTNVVDLPSQKKRLYWADMFTTMIRGARKTVDQRNVTMFNFISFLLDQKVVADTVIQFTNDLNARNKPPMSTSELETIINSAIKRMEANSNEQSDANSSAR